MFTNKSDIFYSSYSEWKKWDGSLSSVSANYYKSEFVNLVNDKSPIKILDFGCGSGEFLSWARSMKADAIGVEISEEAASLPRSKGFTVFTSLDQVENNSIDLITAIDVLEHISKSNLVELINLFKTKLKPNGLIFIRVPNAGSPFGLSTQFGDLTHLTAFTNLSLAQLVVTCEMDVVECRGMKPTTSGIKKLLRTILIASINTVLNSLSTAKYFIDSNLIIIARKR